jgi:hypothetical protein
MNKDLLKGLTKEQFQKATNYTSHSNVKSAAIFGLHIRKRSVNHKGLLSA